MSNTDGATLTARSRHQDRNRDRADCRDLDQRVAVHRKGGSTLSTQVVGKRCQRPTCALRRHLRPGTVKQIPEQFRTQMTIEAVVFELVLEAPETLVTRHVAVAPRQVLECGSENLVGAITCGTQEAGATGKRVVEVHLRCDSTLALDRERRTEVSLHLTRFET